MQQKLTQPVNQLYFNKKYFKTALDVVCVLMVQTLEKLT